MGKLTQTDRQEICRLYQSGVGPKALGTQFGVRYEYICFIVREAGIPTNRKKLTVEDEARIVAKYLARETFEAIARSEGVSTSTIGNVLKRKNCVLRGHATPWTEELKRSLLASIASGKCLTTAAKEIGVGLGLIYGVYDRADAGDPAWTPFAAEIREAITRAYTAGLTEVRENTQRGRVVIKNGRMVTGCTTDETFFETIDTEEKAYFLGWMATDGNVLVGKPSRMSLGLKAEDRPILERFRKALKTDAPISQYVQKGHRMASTGSWVKDSDTCKLMIHSKKLVADLVRLGITPRKTDDVKPWAGPSHLMGHYWRGCLDGDGSIGRYQYGRKKPFWAVTFCGNRFMVNAFADFARGLTDAKMNPRRHGQNNDLWVVRANGVRIPRQLIEVLYRDATVFLDRKRLLAEQLMASAF